MSTPLVMFLIFIAITVGITYWASKRSAGSSAYFAASRRVTGWQNGIARRRRLYERRFIPRDRGHHRLSGIRRLYVPGDLGIPI